MQLELQKNGHKLLKFCLGISGMGRGGPNSPLEPFFEDKNVQKCAEIENQGHFSKQYDPSTRNRKFYQMKDSSVVELWSHNPEVMSSNPDTARSGKWNFLGSL